MKQYLASDDQIATLLSPFGVRLSADQAAKVREYIRLLLKWNQSLSLTSVLDPSEILVRHFGESMFVTSLTPVGDCRLADLGSGAGFPGLALKIACPSLRVRLIESNKKKCAFLSEIARSLELENVEILPERFDSIRANFNFAEMITVRALGGFSEILKWAKASLAHRGHVVLWLGAEDATRVSSSSHWIWQPTVKIPESQRRFILIGRQVPKETV